MTSVHVPWGGAIDHEELRRCLGDLGIRGRVRIRRDPRVVTAEIRTDGTFHDIRIATHSSTSEANTSILHEIAHAEQSERGAFQLRDESPFMEGRIENAACRFASEFAQRFRIAVDGRPGAEQVLSGALDRLNDARREVESAPLPEEARLAVTRAIERAERGLRRWPLEPNHKDNR
jgi:hypothetical protein